MVSIRVNGISGEESLQRTLTALTALDYPVAVDKEPTLKDPILTLTYTPKPPEHTIRRILAAIESTDSSLEARIYHPPTLEERVRAMQARERCRIIYQVPLCPRSHPIFYHWNRTNESGLK